MSALAASASREFPPLLVVLSELQISFQNLVQKQRGDPMLSLLESIICFSGHAAVAVGRGKASRGRLQQTVQRKHGTSIFSGSARIVSKEDNPPLALK